MDTLIYWFYLCTRIFKKDDDTKYIKAIYFASFPFIFNIVFLLYLSNEYLFNGLLMISDPHRSFLNRKLRGLYITIPFGILFYIIIKMKRNYINLKLDDFENQRVKNIKLIRIKLAIYLVLSVVTLLILVTHLKKT